MVVCLKEVLSMININTATLLVSIIALYVACRSRELAQQAFSLSLFNNCYKFYYEFRNLVDELSSMPGFPTEKHLTRLKYLLWESKYMLGKKIETLMVTLLHNTEIVHKKQNPVGTKEDYEIIEPVKTMMRLINELSGKQIGSTLDSYFQQYLYNKTFRQRI